MNHKNRGTTSGLAHSATSTEFDFTEAISRIADVRNALTVWIAAVNTEETQTRDAEWSKPLRVAALSIRQSLEYTEVCSEDCTEVLLNAQALMNIAERSLRNHELGTAKAPTDNELVSVAQMAAEHLETLTHLLIEAETVDYLSAQTVLRAFMLLRR